MPKSDKAKLSSRDSMWRCAGMLNKRGEPFSSKDFDILWDNQNGCCEICGIAERKFKKRLCVDHNHRTGYVRGLLCSPCNTALGIVEDVTFCKKAEIYLNSH